MIKRLIGFMFGFVIAICAGLTMLPKAHGAEPDVVQIVMVVGYQDGHAIGAQAIGFADSLSDCETGLAQMLPELTAHAKPGVTLVAVCTPAPPAPATVHHQGQASI
jgi:hypothetical protein